MAVIKAFITETEMYLEQKPLGFFFKNQILKMGSIFKVWNHFEGLNKDNLGIKTFYQ